MRICHPHSDLLSTLDFSPSLFLSLPLSIFVFSAFTPHCPKFHSTPWESSATGRTSPNKCIFGLSLHHIIGDGWSLRVITQVPPLSLFLFPHLFFGVSGSPRFSSPISFIIVHQSSSDQRRCTQFWWPDGWPHLPPKGILSVPLGLVTLGVHLGVALEVAHPIFSKMLFECK